MKKIILSPFFSNLKDKKLLFKSVRSIQYSTTAYEEDMIRGEAMSIIRRNKGGLLRPV